MNNKYKTNKTIELTLLPNSGKLILLRNTVCYSSINWANRVKRRLEVNESKVNKIKIKWWIINRSLIRESVKQNKNIKKEMGRRETQFCVV